MNISQRALTTIFAVWTVAQFVRNLAKLNHTRRQMDQHENQI